MNDINSPITNVSGLIGPPRATVSMLPWDLNMRSQKDIRTEGLFAALNDCLYRNMYRYNHYYHQFQRYLNMTSNDVYSSLNQISICCIDRFGWIYYSEAQRHSVGYDQVSIIAWNLLVMLYVNNSTKNLPFFICSSLNARFASQRVTSRSTGAYSFQNAFFYLQFPDDLSLITDRQKSDFALRATLLTMRKTRRYVWWFAAKAWVIFHYSQFPSI